ncbi:MAG: DUF2961 domain-containing protein [Deltaproteobacteria bacterium]|nr:DUF2961 domain-containing protein [Deltaproteobacteria bacterium]
MWNLALELSSHLDDLASSIWLVARWDDHAVADVEAPLPLFFGSARTDRPAAGLLFGLHEGRYVSRFPMPFWSAAEVRVENRGRGPVTLAHEIEVLRRAYPAGVRLLRRSTATRRRPRSAATTASPSRWRRPPRGRELRDAGLADRDLT